MSDTSDPVGADTAGPAADTAPARTALHDAPARTALHDLHVARGGKMVPFAGYQMPLQYAADGQPSGIVAEHRQTRAAAGLFDVSHMGQAVLTGNGVAAVLERLVPGDIQGLAPGQMRYTMLLNEDGGIVDDLMVTRPDDDANGNRLFLVVNAARRAVDYAKITDGVADEATLAPADDHALLALQGPVAAAVLARLDPAAATMPFMTGRKSVLDGIAVFVTRSGYTGEDGYEISVPAAQAVTLAERLLSEPEVALVGLGARDTLRLEAGLCLYGNDIDEATTPIEASLTWAVAKRRRTEGGFPGADRIVGQITYGPPRRRIGLLPEGRAPARAGAPVLRQDGTTVGTVTSGTFSPTLERPIAMALVDTAAAKDAGLAVSVRGKAIPAAVTKMPFVPQRYYRG